MSKTDDKVSLEELNIKIEILQDVIENFSRALRKYKINVPMFTSATMYEELEKRNNSGD